MKIGLLVLCLNFWGLGACLAQDEKNDSIVQNSMMMQNEGNVDKKLQVILDLLNNDVIPALTKTEKNVMNNCNNTIDSLRSILHVVNKNQEELKAEQLVKMNKVNSDLVKNHKLIQTKCQHMIESLKTQGFNISPLLLSSIENTANFIEESWYPPNNASLIEDFKIQMLAVSSANDFIEGKLMDLNSIEAEIENLNRAFIKKSKFIELAKEKENFIDNLSVYKDLACELKSKIEEVRILEYNGVTSSSELLRRLENYDLIARFPYLIDCIESFEENPKKNPLVAVKGICQ